MRRRALESDIIIVNHHLFFADLAVKQQAAGAPDAGILPEAAAVVFDEAHELEDVASSYFGLSVSNLRFEELARDTDTLLRGKSGAEKFPAATQQLRDRARMFFANLPMSSDGRQPFDNREEFLETSGDLYLSLRNTLRLLESEMDLLTDIDEAPGLRKRVARLRTELEFLLESNSSNMVYWLERRAVGGADRGGGGRAPGRGQNRHTFVQATPIDVSELLHEMVFESIPTVVLTSATLTVQGGFEHIRKRAGDDGGAGTGGAFALPIWGAGAFVSATVDAGPARSGVSRGGGELHSAGAGAVEGAGVLPVHELRADAGLVRAADAGAGVSDSAAWDCAAEGAAGGVSRRRLMRCCSGRRASGREWMCRARR